jgi:hypothetical protein
MIQRYTLPEMGAIWSQENKFQKWLDVEIAVCEVHAEMGTIPKNAVREIKSKAAFTVERISEIEKTTDHDVIAFTTNLAENIGVASRFVHYGLTSSDVVDTANALLLKESCEIKCAAIQKGREVVQFSAVFPVKTKPAPISASTIIKTNDTKAVLRTLSPFINLRNAQTNNSITTKNAKPVDKRCENSIIVLNCGADGTTSPPHVSQC